MRGAYDFETYEWTKPLCCGLVWGVPGKRESKFIHDTSHSKPLAVSQITLLTMEKLADTVSEWWAHNGGKFDALFLTEAAISLGWSVRGITAGSRAIELQITSKAGAKIVLRDSYSLAPSSLDSCAKDFNLPSQKLFTKTDYSVDTRQWDPAHLKAGCLADGFCVLELLEALETQVDQWGGKLGLTFSSTALSVMRARLKDSPCGDIPSHQGEHWPSQEAGNFCRYGGRVEVFRHAPPNPLVEYDVTSSYPWAMSQTLPWRPLGPVAKASNIHRILDGRIEGLLYCEVNQPETHIPVLPYRAEDYGLYFPTGKWSAWFTANEIRYALTQGVKVKIREAYAYSKESPFTGVVAEMFALKATGKGAVRQFAKLCLNGSYGKLGQGPDVEELRIFSSEKEAVEFIASSNPGSVSPVGKSRQILAVKGHRWPKFTHYAASSYILAYARVLLHKALSAAYSPAYCDTDSVHCDAFDAPQLIGNDLGKLKFEMGDYSARFYAPKIYELHPKHGEAHYASKGFPTDAKSFRKLIALESVPQPRMRTLKVQLKNGGAVVREEGSKVWAGRSGKRKAFPDGETRPWTVKELEDRLHETEICPILVSPPKPKARKKRVKRN